MRIRNSFAMVLAGMVLLSLQHASAQETATKVAATGYQKHKSGTVRIWDLGKKYGKKYGDAPKPIHLGFRPLWNDRAKWRRIPYDQTPERVEADVVVEGSNFYFNLTWRTGRRGAGIAGPLLYAKMDADGTPSRHNLLYRVWWFDPKRIPHPSGNIHGSNRGYVKVLKNTATEAIVEGASRRKSKRGATAQIIATYRVLAGKPWLEITPIQQCHQIGMHGESRIMICPEAMEDGSDYAFDSLKDMPGKSNVKPPASSRILLDFAMDADTIWAMMLSPAKPDEDKTSPRLPLEWRTRRFNLNIGVGGWPSGWQKIGEGRCRRVISAPYGCFLGKKIVIGVLRIGYWHYQKIDSEVKKDEDFTVKWKYVHNRKLPGSPFNSGGPWWPMYAGKWRMISRIDGKYYTSEITINKAG
ncbi:MAG: hypothetical protein KAV00_17585, partial [Phycisphaerae bacterium]|nr:hypothetical protein [Phycisphaerae bacterium]